MSIKHLAIAVLLFTAVSPLMMSPGRAGMTKQAQESSWQPIARINPQKPYTVRIKNQTTVVIEYASTSNEFPPRTLQPGASGTLTKLPLPIYLLISSTDATFRVKYTVTASQNVVTINVQQLAGSSPGNTTINIQETGGIYAY